MHCVLCCSASVYNFNEEEEEDDSSPKEKSEENDKMKQKVTQLRLNMEKLTLTKKVRSYCQYYLVFGLYRLLLHHNCPLLGLNFIQ